jgi:hypothetical protein
MTRMTEIGVMMMTTGRVLMGTHPVASLHQRSAAKEAIEIITTYTMSSTVEMHVAELKTSAKIRSMKSENNAMKGTMITMVLTMTNLTESCHQKRDIS